MTGGGGRGADGALEPWSLHAASAPTPPRPAHSSCARTSMRSTECCRCGSASSCGWSTRAGSIRPVRLVPVPFLGPALREEMVKLATRAGCMIPEERWFTNLYDKGNVGAAVALPDCSTICCARAIAARPAPALRRA